MLKLQYAKTEEKFFKNAEDEYEKNRQEAKRRFDGKADYFVWGYLFFSYGRCFYNYYNVF